MAWILLIATLGALWLLGSSVRSRRSRIESMGSAVDSLGSSPVRAVDTGAVDQIDDHTVCLNPLAPLPLTVSGLSRTEARKLKHLLDQEADWQQCLNEITFLIAQHNVECVELEAYLRDTRCQVDEYIEARKAESREWEIASEKDKSDLVTEFRQGALDRLELRPSNERALATLLFEHPGDVTEDDKLLDRFSGDTDTYRFYLTCLGWGSGVRRVPADGRDRKRWEALVSLDLAKRGKDIEAVAFLEELRLKDINEFFSDRLEKRLTRKAQAVQFASSQSDVFEVLSRHVSFRDAFQVLEPKSLDVSKIRQCYRYAGAQAEIIRDTYAAGSRSLSTVADLREELVSGWVVKAEDCCRGCVQRHGRRTRRAPSRLPPFHIGCTCWLIGE